MRGYEMSALPENWREIAERVNAEVNTLPYKSDMNGDVWDDIDKDGGDCDNYAIGKLRRLLAAGFPIERLRLATCRVGVTGPTQQGEAHAVLALDAPDDQYVLDNLSTGLLTHPALVLGGYIREKIQRTGGSREWVEWKHV